MMGVETGCDDRGWRQKLRTTGLDVTRVATYLLGEEFLEEACRLAIQTTGK